VNCVLGCFNGDTAAAFAAIGALMCVNSSCGSICTPVFDGGVVGESSVPSDGATADAPTVIDAGAPPDDGGASDSSSVDGAGPGD
jgi:hypothetical protein